MQDIIKSIATGRWFDDNSPFRCVIQEGHPKLCVITGPNCSGKSLLRQILHTRYHERQVEYIHLSYAGRCQSGMKRAVIYGDQDEDSTGYNSVKVILKTIQTGHAREKPFAIMLDEPEIGCSEEVQAALAQRILQNLHMPQLHGFFIITHSREFVRQLLPANPTHWRLDLDNLSLLQYVSRQVEPADLEKLMEVGLERWRLVNSMLKRQ